ncbi:MAG: ribulose-phosphate 3-epimerase [Atopobiaceae bacterium]|nr:ribulose-phosphate 3-epimerase [Atopobiaceae bacterium]
MLDREILIAPSILSADFCKLGEDIDSISTADWVHVDVMDGHFVPPVSFGPVVVEAAKRSTELPLDVHLMISNPDDRVGDYLTAGADYLGFHQEAAIHAHRIVSHIHDAGAKATMTLNPATPVNMLEAIIGELDMVLLMSVNPGYGGQAFIESTIDKVEELRALCRRKGVCPLIEVDGGVTKNNAAALVAAGADVLVAGSAVYGAEDRAAAIEELRRAAQSGLVRGV